MENKTCNCLLIVVNWQIIPKVNTKQSAELECCLVDIQIFLYDKKIILFKLRQSKRKSSLPLSGFCIIFGPRRESKNVLSMG